MVLKKIFMLGILIALVFAIKSQASTFYQSSYLGEKNLQTYHGPIYPDIEHDLRKGSLSWKDENVQMAMFAPFLSREVFNLQDFVQGELNYSYQCPLWLLGQAHEYMRYIYRLLSISYLYEAVNYYQSELTYLGKGASCRPDWKQVFSSCKPKSKDMTSYLKNLLQFGDFFVNTVDPNKRHQDFESKWFQDFYGGKTKSVSQMRLLSDCEDEGENCRLIGRNNLKAKLAKLCKHDLKMIKKVCSERDRLYGLSTIPEAIEVLMGSNVINVFNQTGQARQCLVQYSQSLSPKEEKYKFFVDLFSELVIRTVNKYGDQYLQGKIFIPGSFKEFEQKGLKFVYDKPKPQVAKVKTSINENVPEKEELIVADSKITVRKKKAPKVVAKKRVVKKKVVKKPKKSAFLVAAEFRDKQDLESVTVDMNKFKYDFIFTFSQLTKLNKPLKEYMSHDALKEMKKFDKLGTPDGPVPLVFIKYMIDTKKHQGLYNIIHILGDRFFVKNDIDNLNRYPSNYVQLENNPGTNLAWEIKILDPELAAKAAKAQQQQSQKKKEATIKKQ